MEKKENNYQILKYWTQNPVQISYIYNFFETYTKMRLTVYVLSSALSTAKDSESFKIVSENILNTSFPPSWEKKSFWQEVGSFANSKAAITKTSLQNYWKIPLDRVRCHLYSLLFPATNRESVF